MVLTCNLVRPPNLEVNGQWSMGLEHSSLPNCAMFLNKKPTGGKLERGTPIENKVDELHSIFDFVNYGYLGTQEHSSAAPLRRSEG